MTAFRVHGVSYELTLYMDLWNNEIVAHALSAKRGDRMTYISGLNNLIELKKGGPAYRKHQEMSGTFELDVGLSSTIG